MISNIANGDKITSFENSSLQNGINTKVYACSNSSVGVDKILTVINIQTDSKETAVKQYELATAMLMDEAISAAKKIGTMPDIYFILSQNGVVTDNYLEYSYDYASEQYSKVDANTTEEYQSIFNNQ